MNVREIVSYSKQVEKNNVAYGRLGPKAKRLAIAKDALGQLLLGKVNGEGGTYLRSTHDEDLSGTPKEIASKVLALPECFVCAKGAIMLSQIRHRKTCDFGGTGNSASLYPNSCGFDNAFSDLMRSRMEAAFETWDGSDLAHVGDEDVRLFAILENIVENQGDFDPQQFYTDDMNKFVDATTARFSKARATATRKRKAA